MRYHARFVTCFAMFALLLICAHTWGQGSVYEVPLEPMAEEQESFEVFADEALAEDSLFGPTIDITAEGFVSNLPPTAWSAGVDFVAFQPSVDYVDFSENGDDVFFVSPRLFVGWENESGFGIRSRLWGFEAEGRIDSVNSGGFSTLRGFDFRGAQTGDSTGTEPFELRAGSLDLDFYKRFGEGNTSLTLGAALKSAALQYERVTTSEHTIAGLGAGVFSDLRQLLYQNDRSEIALVGSGRVSYVVGESRFESTETSFNVNPSFISPVIQEQSNTLIEKQDARMTVSEAALGLEWKRDLGWSVLTLRGQYETQFWNTDVGNDLSFNGGVVRAGLSW